MIYFKLHKGVCDTDVITKENFEGATEFQYPYYTNKGCLGNQYAYCPTCDNPIEILGLYKPLKNTLTPFGKHTGKDVEGLGKFDYYDYEWCPYSSRKASTLNHNTRKDQKTEKDIIKYNLMRDNFDIVVRIIEDVFEIKFTRTTLRQYLNFFVNNDYYLYPGMSYNNIPWVFVYLNFRRSIYKQMVKNDSELYSALSKIKNIQLDKSAIYEDYSLINNKQGCFAGIEMALFKHKLKNNVESVELRVYSGKDNVVFSKEIQIDQNRFRMEIQENQNRNNELREMAREILPEL